MLDSTQYTLDSVDEFRAAVYRYYEAEGRHDLPWRDNASPWEILVSEVMLQQTQVNRVCEKYLEFFAAFPTVNDLADAEVADLLAVWKGLGYNRRALNLQRAARMVVSEFGGTLPEAAVDLVKLPGIGPATASAIRTYAFNQPEVYVETNIRAVFIHHFFEDRGDVHDSELLPLIKAALDKESPFRWYSALMDYGTAIKKEFGNPARRSKHHVKQSKFEGSNRQLRSRILSAVMESGGMTATALAMKLETDADQVKANSEALVSEGFMVKDKRTYRIK